MLLNGVLRSVLGGRRKRSRRAMRYLGSSRSPFGGTLGSIGGSLLSNPNVLLTAAGVAWGIFETLATGQHAGGCARSGVAGVECYSDAAVAAVAGGWQRVRADERSSAPDRPPRDIRRHTQTDPSATRSEPRFWIRRASPEWIDIVEQELAQPRPLAEIVAGVNDDTHRGTLYVLAFGILRGDEQPTRRRTYLLGETRAPARTGSEHGPAARTECLPGGSMRSRSNKK